MTPKTKVNADKRAGARRGAGRPSVRGEASGRRVAATERGPRITVLPVDPARLREQFPALTDEDVAAWSEVTARVLSAGPKRGAIVMDVVARGRAALARQAAGETLSGDDDVAARYIVATEKMQASTVPGRRPS